MADIKTRDAVKGTIKTIDKAAIASERMKSAYAGIKEKAEQGYYADENSATEYAADRISFAADRVKDEGMTLRLDGLYDTIVELEERIEDAKLRKSSIEMETITLDNIYKLMLNFGKLYDIISDEEKKSLITYLIKEIQIYPNGESEQPLKSIEFNFPIYRDGQEVRRLLWEKGNTVETVCLLSKLHAKQHIEIDLSMDELDLTAAESKATYDEIKAYVLEKYGLKVSSLYISQVKRKCGLDVGQNYNLPKKEDAKVPQCPPEKEAAIIEALKHFQMIS